MKQTTQSVSLSRHEGLALLLPSILLTCKGDKALGWQMSFWIFSPLAFAASMYLAIHFCLSSQSTVSHPSIAKHYLARIQTWSRLCRCLYALVVPYCLQSSFPTNKRKEKKAQHNKTKQNALTRSLWLFVAFLSRFLPTFLFPSTLKTSSSQETSPLVTSASCLQLPCKTAHCSPWICVLH